MLFLLCLGAVFQQRRAEHRNTKAGQRLPRADRGHLLPQDFCLFLIEAAATILPWPVRHRPALVAHALEPHPLRLGGERCVAPAPERVFVGRHRAPHFRRTVGFQPGARLAAELFEIRHRCVSID
jgi:hypothetical protein